MEKQLINPSNPLKKYIWTAIGILGTGVILGILSVIIFKSVEGIYGISSSIVLSFLAFAFSYLQFYLNKYETEKRDIEYSKQIEERTEYDKNKERIRRINNLKLMAYKDIMTNLDDLVLRINNEFGKKIYLSLKEDLHNKIRIASDFLSIEFSYNSLKSRVKYYEKLLATDIWSSELDKIHNIFEDLLNADSNFEKYTINMLECKSKIDEHIFEILIAENPDYELFNFNRSFF